MKKLYIICILTFMCIGSSSYAQYTNLLDFDGTINGKYPLGSLISVGDFLYGMTPLGGTNNFGTIFKISSDGTGYVKLLDFAGATNGRNPRGSLMFDGTFLYGMTYQGGTNTFGTIFKILPDGSGYVKLLDFDKTTNGSSPEGALISDGTYLYGMTYLGGANERGTIFKILPDGTGYEKLIDFAGVINGSEPRGSLFYDGTFLYGMTYQGGTNAFGTIFKIRPNGTDYIKLLDFEGITNGSNPLGSLISDGTFLYGMTETGDTNQLGNIFKILPNGTGYSNLLNFDGATNGNYPLGSLIYDGTFLYGVNQYGGANDFGTIFKIMPNGTGYSNLLNFSGGTNGKFPRGSLTSDGTSLYGMASEGGTNNFGVVFKYGLTLGIDELLITTDGLTFYPNPSKDIITFQNILEKSKLQIFDASGKKLIQLDVDSNSNSINISSLSEGIYILKINNQFVGKLVKE